MAKKRVVLRCKHDTNLTISEQETFADDVAKRLDGTDLGGYFTVQGGWDWVEWEGDKQTVENKAQAHVQDKRVDSYDVVESTDISSTNYSKRVYHTAGDEYDRESV